MNKLRFFRKKAGLTQGELAEKAGVALDTISRYETGKTTPSAKVLLKISLILDSSVEELFSDWEGES